MTTSNWYKVTIYNDGVYFTVNTFSPSEDQALIDAQQTIERLTNFDPLWAGETEIRIKEFELADY